MSSPWERSLQAWERLAAWQPCPQHYSWYKSLCFCCPQDSFIHFPLSLENRSLFFFSFLYRSSGSREELNSLALRTTASTRRELHLLVKDGGDRPILLRTRLQLSSGSIDPNTLDHFIPSAGGAVPLQMRYLPTLGPPPGPVPPAWRWQLPEQLSPALGKSPAISSCSWWRPCNSHLNPTCVHGIQIRNGGREGKGSSRHWKPSSNSSQLDTSQLEMLILIA